MKKILILIIVLLPFLQGCRPEEDSLGDSSNLDVSTPDLTTLDLWLRDNFTKDFNIEVHYRWNENIVDFNNFLRPPTVDKVQPAMEAIKTIWLDTYSEVGGADFVKRIAPRELVLVGGQNRNQNGTVTLGQAEQGARVALFEIDDLDLSDKSRVLRFLGTVQHEYVHILNQTVPFDEVNYGNITPSSYTAQWNQRSLTEANELGFITKYSRDSVLEDFAEMVKVILSNTNDEYNAIIDAIPSDVGKANIRRKEQIIVNYFKAEFAIDLYELQRVAAENVQKVIN